MNHRNLLCFCLIVFFAEYALTADSPAAQPPVAPRIIDGTSHPVSDFPTVGQIKVTEGQYLVLATGTLVSPDHVLTAAHTFFDSHLQPVNPNQVTFVLNGQNYGVASVTIHPTYIAGISIDVENQFDIAIMALTQPVPGIQPSPYTNEPPTVGVTVTIAGYGLLGTGATGEQQNSLPPDGTIDAGTTVIDTVTPTFIKWNFHAGDSNTANGDSGGPAFVDISGTQFLCAVTSGGQLSSAAYGDVSFDTRVDPIFQWIQDILSGREPVVNVPSSKHSFKIDFRGSQRSSLSMTLDNVRAQVPVRSATQQVNVFIADTQIDNVMLKNSRGTGNGSLSINPRSGQVRYSLKNAALAQVLTASGATNANTSTAVLIPFYIEMGGTRYGGSYTFSYVAKQNQYGIGR